VNKRIIVRRKNYEFDLTKIMIELIDNARLGIYPRGMKHTCGSYSKFWHDDINYIDIEYSKGRNYIENMTIKLDFKLNKGDEAKPLIPLLNSYKSTYIITDFNITKIDESSSRGNRNYYDIHIELAENDINDSVIYENIKFDDLINKIKHIIGGKDER
jgi:hypothetical protein